jgi:hypothetical protein
MGKRPLTVADVACWVLKRRPGESDPRAAWRDGAQVTGSCLFPTYRVELMAPGQRCLLWLSGRRDPGVVGVGTLADHPRPRDLGEGPPGPDPDGPDRARLYVAVDLHLLAAGIPRSELAEDPRFAGAEVLRMPAGSNPSFLTGEQLAAVEDRLSDADLAASGWTGVG